MNDQPKTLQKTYLNISFDYNRNLLLGLTDEIKSFGNNVSYITISKYIDRRITKMKLTVARAANILSRLIEIKSLKEIDKDSKLIMDDIVNELISNLREALLYTKLNFEETLVNFKASIKTKDEIINFLNLEKIVGDIHEDEEILENATDIYNVAHIVDRIKRLKTIQSSCLSVFKKHFGNKSSSLSKLNIYDEE